MFPKPQQKSFSSSSYMLSLIQYQFYSHNDFKKFRCHDLFLTFDNAWAFESGTYCPPVMNAMPMKKSLYLQMAGSHPTEYRTIPFSTIVLHALMGSFPVGQPFGNSSATCPRPCGGASAEKKSQRGPQLGAKCRIQERYSFWRFWVSGNPKILLCLWFSRF